MAKLVLDSMQVQSCRRSAAVVAKSVMRFAAGRSTVSIGRSIPRLLRLSGVDAVDVQRGLLDDGVAMQVGKAAVSHRLSVADALAALARGDITSVPLRQAGLEPATRFIEEAASERWTSICETLCQRHVRRQELGESAGTRTYVLTATDNVRHAEAVAQHDGCTDQRGARSKQSSFHPARTYSPLTLAV